MRQPARGILLFGPPGNGKTMLARWIASEANCTFFNISAASIMSKWVGEAEKLISTLFQMAKNGQPSIIFIDEIDSILCDRTSAEGEYSRRVKTEFLIQFDGCISRSEDHVLVLGATNRPYELDDGILRRFTNRIFIDLPDAETRKQLILKKLESERTHITEQEIKDFANELDRYSHNDIVDLCRTTAKELTYEKFGGIIEMTTDMMKLRRAVEQVTPSQLRPITTADLKESLNKIKPTTNEENYRKLQEFAKKHAQEDRKKCTAE